MQFPQWHPKKLLGSSWMARRAGLIPTLPLCLKIMVPLNLALKFSVKLNWIYLMAYFLCLWHTRGSCESRLMNANAVTKQKLLLFETIPSLKVNTTALRDTGSCSIMAGKSCRINASITVIHLSSEYNGSYFSKPGNPQVISSSPGISGIVTLALMSMAIVVLGYEARTRVSWIK